MTDLPSTEPGIGRPVGVSSAALPMLDPEQLCAAAVAVGISGVEWGAGSGQVLGVGPDASRLTRLAELAARADLRCCGISVHDDGALAYPSAVWHRLVDAAVVLGAPHVRVYSPPLERDFTTAFSRLQAELAKLAETVSAAGLRLLLEPAPRTLTPSPALARDALLKADPDAVGVVYDPGSLAREGWLDPFLTVGVLGALLCHVHVKNVAPVRTEGGGWRWDHVSLADGIVDWARVRQAIDSVGYSQWLVLDHLSTPSPDALIGDLAALRAFLRVPS